MLSETIEPIHVVNRYLWDELKKRMSPTEITKYNYGNIMPIFPVNDSTSGDAKWINRPYFVYTQAFRVTHGLHVLKKATFVYSLKSNVNDFMGWASALQDILDRQDDAAADINEYNWSLGNGSLYCPVIFHSFRVYQNEPAKPSSSVSTPSVSATFMVVAEYHLV
jgi:hypothetical protein